jgi:mono/diheme cytochrome c family protein
LRRSIASRRDGLAGPLFLAALVSASLIGHAGRPGLAQTAAAPAAPPAGFTREYLGDPKNVEQGREVWQTRCQFCHGKAAYPGKAPKLDPSRYTPDFVYDRVSNGFKGMPGWKQEFSEQQLRAVVAYVLSKGFSN